MKTLATTTAACLPLVVAVLPSDNDVQLKFRFPEIALTPPPPRERGTGIPVVVERRRKEMQTCARMVNPKRVELTIVEECEMRMGERDAICVGGEDEEI